jgi:hypothetical protein
MRSQQEGSSGRPQIELSLDDYKVNGGTIGHSRDGTSFAFTIGPLPDDALAALEVAAQEQARICLYCCRAPLSFELVALERKGPRKVRIAGRIVGGIRMAAP